MYYAELDFWRISRNFISDCCRKRLEDQVARDGLTETVPADSTTANQIFSRAQKMAYKMQKIAPSFAGQRCERFRLLTWVQLENPEVSLLALVFCILSVGFVACTIVVLVLGSLPAFNILSDHDKSPFFECKPCKFPVPLESNKTKDKKQLDNDNIMIGETQLMIHPDPSLDLADAICVAWFILEYFLRLWATPNLLIFIKKPLSIIDVLSIIPFFIETIFRSFCFCETTAQELNKGLLIMRILRLLRVLRVLRVLKLARYSMGFRLIGRSLHRSISELMMLGTFVFMITIIYSTIIYFIESETQNSKYVSILEAAYYVVVTFTTVGYGDIYPTTSAGQLVAVFICFSGVVLLAFPVSIIVEKFGRCFKELRDEKEKEMRALAMSVANSENMPRIQ